MTRPGRGSAGDRLTILVTGYIVRRPVGGLAWHYAQYVVGLKQLGHRVIFMEDSEDFPSCWIPPSLRAAPSTSAKPGRGTVTFHGLERDPSYGLQFTQDLFDRLGVGSDWCYFDVHTDSWMGPAASAAPELIQNADVLLNLSGSITLRPWHMAVPKRVLVDTDPVFSQARHLSVPASLDRTLRHNVFLTFGENIGRPGCAIPDDGLPWLTTRQPIVMDLWANSAEPTSAAFTTVMSWKSYDPGHVDGRRYGLKEDSFGHFLSLPKRTRVELEIALEGPEQAWTSLQGAGWKLIDAGDVTRTPWGYRDYIQASRGEFSVAKEAYAMTHSGWFSERTAAYLASGRPGNRERRLRQTLTSRS